MVSRSVSINREFFFICVFFYISRCKWQHDRRKSRNDSHIQLEVDATNDDQNHLSDAISTNDTPSSSISNVKEENNK